MIIDHAIYLKLLAVILCSAVYRALLLQFIHYWLNMQVFNHHYSNNTLKIFKPNDKEHNGWLGLVRNGNVKNTVWHTTTNRPGQSCIQNLRA